MLDPAAEIAAALVWTLVILGLTLVWRHRLRPDDPLRRYLVPAMVLKLLGAVCVGLVYQFFYGYGDTLGYHNNSARFVEVFYNSPQKYLALWLMDYDTALLAVQSNYFSPTFLNIGWAPSYFTLLKLTSLFEILTFQQYYATAELMAFVSLFGITGFYRAFTYFHPQGTRLIAFSCFFIPSLFFWGSGLLKDTFTLMFLGSFIYGLYQIFVRKRQIVLWAIMIWVSAYFIYQIKPYILIAAVPPSLLWLYVMQVARVKNAAIRQVIAPAFLVLCFVGALFVVLQLGFNFNLLAQEAADNYEAVTDSRYRDGQGSVYDLGEWEPSLLGMLSRFPIATWTTLFRPHPWEARNAVMALASLESTLFLFAALYLLYRRGPRRVLASVLRTPLMALLLGYGIFFSFMVGLSSGNFGNLVRYKIPALPFLASAYGILWVETDPKRKLRSAAATAPQVSPRPSYPKTLADWRRMQAAKSAGQAAPTASD